MDNKPIPPEEERFSSNTNKLGEAIKICIRKLFDMGYQTVDLSLVEFAVIAIANYDKHALIQGFIKNSHAECWDKIKVRDEQYFVDNSAKIFAHLPAGEVNLFKDLFTTKDKNGNSVIEQEFKNKIWTLFDALVKISIKYVHKGRDPYVADVKGVATNAYSKSFFDDVNVQYHAINWNVILEFNIQY